MIRLLDIIIIALVVRVLIVLYLAEISGFFFYLFSSLSVDLVQVFVEYSIVRVS